MASFVAAVFFEQREDNSFKYFFSQNSDSKQNEIAKFSLLPEDLDPSFNLALARGLFCWQYKNEVSTMEQYIKVLNSQDTFTHLTDILYNINQCDTLIEGNHFKIFFLPYAAFQAKITLHESDLAHTTEETQKFFQENDLEAYLANNLKAQKTLFCILNSEDKLNWTNLYEGIFQGLFQKSNQKWISISLVQMQTVSEDLLKQFKGFIVTGSHYDAYDTTMPWINFTYDFINKIIYPEQPNEQKLVGICWGHQAIGHGCGGKASQMPHKNKYQFRDEIQMLDVDFHPEFNLKLLPQPFYGIKCHGDYVFELPKEGKLICSSDKVQIEGMSIGDRALSFQFHPEFNKMLLFKILDETHGEDEYVSNQIKFANQSFIQDPSLSNAHMISMLKKFLNS